METRTCLKHSTFLERLNTLDKIQTWLRLWINRSPIMQPNSYNVDTRLVLQRDYILKDADIKWIFDWHNLREDDLTHYRGQYLCYLTLSQAVVNLGVVTVSCVLAIKRTYISWTAVVKRIPLKLLYNRYLFNYFSLPHANLKKAYRPIHFVQSEISSSPGKNMIF